MKFLLLLIILNVQFIENEGFFSGSVSSILNSLARNISCLNQITTTYNGTTNYYDITSFAVNNISFSSPYIFGAAYCIVYQITQIKNGLLNVQTTWTMTSGANEFRNTAINRWVVNLREVRFRDYNETQSTRIRI
jgi:hypothetical protein